MIDLKKIKLIVWDLDDTFWKGTLSEEEPQVIEKNLELIKQLNQRGIVSSICSKNDPAEARAFLERIGIWDSFVFCSINWEPKGQRLADTIQNMALRPVNVLFIDDNISNLKEAEFFAKGIMTSLPEDCLPELWSCAGTLGKDDMQLSRLKQYKVLEKKHSAAEKASSNEEFLYSCHVCIEIRKDCAKELMRIEELIQRSNQLNYTKLRSDTQQVEQLLDDDGYESGYIIARDDFGDYGVIGFYSLARAENKLKHFLFSCRTMGMGIEQYVYAKLGYPKIDIIGDVATGLTDDPAPGWISEDTQETAEAAPGNTAKKQHILFKGPCDIQSSLAFLKDADSFDQEFTFVNKKGYVISSQNSTFHVLQAAAGDAALIDKYRDDIPFWDDALYRTCMFTSGYDVVFLSVFKDAVSGLYESRDGDLAYVFDDWFLDITDPEQWERYTKDSVVNEDLAVFQRFAEKFTYKGRIEQSRIVENLKQIRALLDPNTLLVITVPTSFAYVDSEEPRKNDRHNL